MALAAVSVADSVPELAWEPFVFSLDWVTFRQRNFGRWPELNDGFCVNYSPEGEALFTRHKRVECEGSFSSKLTVLVTSDWLHLSFNPSRWNRAHNVFGVDLDSAWASAQAFLVSRGMAPMDRRGIRGRLNDGTSFYSGACLTRADLATVGLTGSAAKAEAWMRWPRSRTLPRCLTAVKSGSVYIGNKRHELVFYLKGPEVRKNNPAAVEVAEVLTELGAVRAEWRMRARDLREAGLREFALCSMEALIAVAKRKLSEAVPTESGEIDLTGLTRNEACAFLLWRDGYDRAAMRRFFSQSAWYRLRKGIRSKIGFDIGAEAPSPSELEPKAERVRVVPYTPEALQFDLLTRRKP